jgi:hypothetical protein
VISSRRPRNLIGWLLLGIAAALLLSTAAGLYALLSYRLGYHLPGGPVALLVYQLWSPALAAYLLVIVLFPDGRPSARQWQLTAWAYAALCVGYLALLESVAAVAIVHHRIQVDTFGGLRALDYPAGRLALTQNLILVLVVVLGAVFAARQLMAWRHSAGDRREQLKWLLFGTAIYLVCAALSIPGETSAAGFWAVLTDVLSVGFIALPVSVGVGILKYHLYEIDRLISRTLSYAIVTGLLLGVYAGLVTLAHTVLPATSPLVVALSTLVAAALLRPVLHLVQHRVDKRFNRARYDADEMAAAFGARMQDAADLDMVQRDLIGMVSGAVEPAFVTVWLADREIPAER